MPEPEQSKQSFSSGRRWVFRLNFLLGMTAFIALLVMVNYLGGGYYKRFHVDALDVTRLSPQTLRILEQEVGTNKVDITIFFNPSGEEDLYNLTADLLAEYKNANPDYISVRTLDYNRFDGEARLLLGRLNLMGVRDKGFLPDFVLFECNGRSKICYAKNLANWDVNAALKGQALRRSEFQGERLFTSAIFSLIHPQPLKTYFLAGHGETDPNESTSGEGCSKLAGILKEELNTDWQMLSLQGTNFIPIDCQLLVVGGPKTAGLLPAECQKIDSYLKQGGRMLLMLNSLQTNSRAESILKQWGIQALDDHVIEKDDHFAIYESKSSFLAAGLLHHPILDAIIAQGNISIQLNSPRPFLVKEKTDKLGEAKVSVLATSSKLSTLSRQPEVSDSYNLIVAVEQNVIKGVNNGTRVLAIGDSSLLNDHCIDMAGNHTFAWLALNWLLERPEILLEGLTPRPIKEYKLLVTNSQVQAVELIFLVGLPGVAFLIGGLVWLRRRR